MSVDSPEIQGQGLTLDKLGREFAVIQEEIRTEMVVYKKSGGRDGPLSETLELRHYNLCPTFLGQ